MARTAPETAERLDGSARAPRSLEDRVRDLQLHDKIDGKKSGGAALWLPWILCAMLLFVTVSIGWQLYTRSGDAKGRSIGASTSSGGKADAESNGSDTPTEAAPSGSLVLETRGYIIPAHQIQVSPIEIAGRIKEIKFEEGQWFEEGQELARIDDVSYRADYEESEAMVESTRAKWQGMEKSWKEEIVQAAEEVAEAEKMLEKLAREKDRMLRVAEKSGVATAEKELDDALFNWKAQQHRVNKMKSALVVTKGPREETIKAARAEHDQAKARRDRAKWRLENCVIRAPVSGNILTKKAEIGNLVSPMSFNVSASLCEMADLTKLEVDLEVQEREIAKVEMGQKCKVRCDAYPKRTWDGEVIRIMPVALRAKSAVQVRVRVLNIPKAEAGKFLRPDMNASVSFYAK